jgi:hypothetical protein
MDDILIVNNDVNQKLFISSYWDALNKGFENMKTHLLSSVLPNTIDHKIGVDSLINDLKTARVYIDTSELTPGTWQFEDYSTVWTRELIYRTDDKITLTDPDTPRPNDSYMNLEIKRPFCTLGNYDMSLYEFQNSKLCATNSWHSQRFTSTVTSNLQIKTERLANDLAWFQKKTEIDEITRIMHPPISSFKTNEETRPHMLREVMAPKSQWVSKNNTSHDEIQRARRINDLRNPRASSSSSQNISSDMYENDPFSTTFNINGITPMRYSPHSETSLMSYPLSPQAGGTLNRGPRTNNQGSSAVTVLATELPKLTIFNKISIDTFLEECEAKQLSDLQILNQVNEDKIYHLHKTAYPLS